MFFKNIDNLDILIRKAEWNDTVGAINKIALEVGPEDDLKNKLLEYLEKDKKKYKNKLNYYKEEYKKIKEMIKRIQEGESFENVSREMLNRDEDLDEFADRRDGEGLVELTEQEAIKGMDRNY